MQISMKYDEALEQVGGFGTFQWITSVAMIKAVISGDFIINSMAFYEIQPAYQCKSRSKTGTDWYSCTPDDFCGEEGSIEYRVDWSDEYSLSNWVEDLGMTCMPAA